MAGHILTLALIFAALSFSNAGSGSLKDQGISSIRWSHEKKLDSGFIFKWTSTDPEYITMEMTAPGKGYVSIGFSPDGQMKDSDFIMGWVDSEGKAHIKDLYGIGNTKPKEDTVQNVELLSGEENENGTTIIFRRKWNSCDDEHDMKLGDDTIIVVWAFNEKDPDLADTDGVFRPPYHFKNRGKKFVYLRMPQQHTPFPDDQPSSSSDAKSWDVRIENNQVNEEDDLYFCKIAKFPSTGAKTQIIGFRPMLVEDNKKNVYQMKLYQCRVPKSDVVLAKTFEDHSKLNGQRCHAPNMATPKEWTEYCKEAPVLWTARSEGYMFPEDVGAVIREETESVYFMFEIHYDNPKLVNFTDSSGLRVFYTEKLRDNEGSVLSIGSKISPLHVVPQGLQSFSTVGFCTSECTMNGIPPNGITALSVLLQMNKLGRKVTLRHFRDGKELPPIAEDNHFSYKYQHTRVLKTGRRILPGDELMTVCEYDSTARDSPTFGGPGTRDETCASRIYYYPRIDFVECKTLVQFESFTNALGVKQVEGDVLKEINMPYMLPSEDDLKQYPDNAFTLKNSTYEKPLNALDAVFIKEGPKEFATIGDLLRNTNWTEDGRASALEKAWMEGKHYAFCTKGNQKRIALKNYVAPLPYGRREKVEDEECKVPDQL